MFYNIQSTNNSSKFVGVHLVQLCKLLVEGLISTFKGVTIKLYFVMDAFTLPETITGAPISACKLVLMPIVRNYNFGKDFEAVALKRHFDELDVIF